jgi:hypothetical protein
MPICRKFSLTLLGLVGLWVLTHIPGAAFADPLPKIEQKFENGAVLRFYGQINKGFLNYDDGEASETYDFIDNNNSNTRFGLTYKSTFAETWEYLGTVEIQYAPYSTSNINILTQTPPSGAYDLSNANIRKIDNQFTNERLGVFYIGQGNMASQDTAEVDLSGTTVITKSAVQESAAAQLFRQSDGTLSKVQIKNAFTNYNGLGRKVRLRYDTPAFNGFSLRTSFGRDLLYQNDNEAVESAVQDQNLYDLALAYEGESGDFEYAAQVAWSYKESYAVNGKTTNGVHILDGSGSVLHNPTGLSLTLAAGEQDNGTVTGSYGFVKAGWQADLVPWGKTAFAVDYYSGTDINGVGSDSNSTAVSVVQNITNWNTELWATYRVYAYEDTKAEYDDGRALFLGARFKF